MIEALFATQQSWATFGIDDKDKLFSIASREGSLSKDEFNRCLADRDLFDKIVADRNYAYETRERGGDNKIHCQRGAYVD